MLCTLSLVSACPTKQVPKSIEEVKPHQAKIDKRVTLFLDGMFKKKTAQVLAQTSYPFLFNNQTIMNNEQELGAIFKRLFQSKTTQKYTISKRQIMTPAAMPQFNMGLWSRLLKINYHKKVYVYLELNIQGSSPRKENLLFLVDPTDDWKIVGFVS